MATYTNLTDVNIASTISAPVSNVTYCNMAGAVGASIYGGSLFFTGAPSAANFANLVNTVNNMISVMKGMA